MCLGIWKCMQRLHISKRRNLKSPKFLLGFQNPLQDSLKKNYLLFQKSQDKEVYGLPILLDLRRLLLGKV